MQTCDTRVTQRGMDIMKCSPMHASAVNSRKRIWSRVKLYRSINNIKLIQFHAPTQNFVVFNFPTVLPTVHKWNWPLVRHNCTMTSSQKVRPFPDSCGDGQGFLFNAWIVKLTFVQHSREKGYRAIPLLVQGRWNGVVRRVGFQCKRKIFVNHAKFGWRKICF